MQSLAHKCFLQKLEMASVFAIKISICILEMSYNNLEIKDQKTKHDHKPITEPEVIETYLCVVSRSVIVFFLDLV